MSRSVAWAQDGGNPRWICSECEWNYPLPTLLTDPEARTAFDRLAHARFEKHNCADHPKQASTLPGGDTLADRARKFIAHGYKPKDAVQLILDEIELEYRQKPSVIEKARKDAEEFLRKLRQGQI